MASNVVGDESGAPGAKPLHRWLSWWPRVVLALVLVLLVLGFPARGVGMCSDGVVSGSCTQQTLSWKGSVSWPTASWFPSAYLGVTLLVLSGLVASLVGVVTAARPARRGGTR